MWPETFQSTYSLAKQIATSGFMTEIHPDVGQQGEGQKLGMAGLDTLHL